MNKIIGVVVVVVGQEGVITMTKMTGVVGVVVVQEEAITMNKMTCVVVQEEEEQEVRMTGVGDGCRMIDPLRMIGVIVIDPDLGKVLVMAVSRETNTTSESATSDQQKKILMRVTVQTGDHGATVAKT